MTNWNDPENWEYYPGSNKKIVPNKTAPTKTLDNDKPFWDRPRVIRHGTEDVEFFTIGQLGQAFGGRSAVTMRSWEAAGVLPKAKFRAASSHPNGKWRYYTRPMLEGMVAIGREEGILDKSSRKPIGSTNFTVRVTQLFKELGEL